jgi:hypothetical protein
MVLFQEAIFRRIDLQNRIVHSLGIVACFISAIVQGRSFGVENCLKYIDVLQKECSDVAQSGVRSVLRLVKIHPIPFKTRTCGRLLMRPTRLTLISPTGSHALKFGLAVGTASFFEEGSRLFKSIPTCSRTRKPNEDIHSPFELGPPKDCVYDGETEKKNDNI